MSAAILTEEFNLAELQKELATIEVNAHCTASCTVNPPRPHIRLDLPRQAACSHVLRVSKCNYAVAHPNQCL